MDTQTQNRARIEQGLRRRHRRDIRFAAMARASAMLAVLVLATLLIVLGARGIGGFAKTSLQLELVFAEIDPLDPEDPEYDPIEDYDFVQVLTEGVVMRLGLAPDQIEREQWRELRGLLGAFEADDLAKYMASHREEFGTTQTSEVLLSDIADQYLKYDLHQQLSANQRAWLDQLQAGGAVIRSPNWRLLTAGDSREPEYAGLLGALQGSLWMMLVTIMLSLPLGVLSAIYLEELAAQHSFTRFLELTVNNLAAVPSIVFGLLGLSVLIQTFGLPRAAPVTGGVVLAMMTFPVIVVATRAALAAVPHSFREGALAMGATRLQAVFHHVLPYAMPGILTGSIIGVARALGESAPLLMIGMVAFVSSVTFSPTAASTALPAQVFIWSDLSERAFVEKTAAAILVLLLFMLASNLTAVILRNYYDRKQA